MSLLWRSDALVEAMGGRPVGTLPESISGISIDTRTLQPGDAFYAITGDSLDGHDFATAAVKAGASLLVVAESKLPALGRLTTPKIVVPDVLAGLEKTGIAARERATKAKIIAVTGSAGKTTTKEALRHVLSTSGKVHAAYKSFNNHWGVPLTLARMPEDCDFAVFEIGMNHPGEIAHLVTFVRPHIALITLIAAAHLGHFENLEAIARAKAEIFGGVERGGQALINRDDAMWPLLEKAARDSGIEHIWSFGEHPRATFRLSECELEGESSKIVVQMAGREFHATVGVPGRHIVQNALAVLGAAYLAGAEMTTAVDALAGLKSEQGRGQRHVLAHPDGGQIVVIDESYNANPASMRAALELLHATPVAEGGRRIAVLGDMRELGSHSHALHTALAEPIADTQPDVVILGGAEMATLDAALPEAQSRWYREDPRELEPLLLEALRPGDAVMIKSSNGLRFSRLVDLLLATFPVADIPAANTDQH